MNNKCIYGDVRYKEERGAGCVTGLSKYDSSLVDPQLRSSELI